MSAHHKASVKEVVLLVRLVRFLLHFLQLELVLTFLIYLRDDKRSEAKSTSLWIILEHFLAETEHIHIYYLCVPGISVLEPDVALHKVVVSEWEVAEIFDNRIHSDRVVCEDQRCFNGVDQVCTDVVLDSIVKMRKLELIVVRYRVFGIILAERIVPAQI